MNKRIEQQFIDTFSAAEKLCAEGQYDESLDKYQRLLEIQPDHVSVLNNIGLVYEKKDHFTRAAEYYRQCYQQQPAQLIICHNLANALTKLGHWEECLPLLEQLVETDFENENNTEKYALCLFNIRPKQEACEYIQSAVTRYPDNRLLYRLLGRALLEMNAHVDGLHYLQKGAGVIEFDANGTRYLN